MYTSFIHHLHIIYTSFIHHLYIIYITLYHGIQCYYIKWLVESHFPMGFGAAEDAFRHHRLWPQRRFPGGHDFSPFILVVYGATWIYLQVSSFQKMENTGIVIDCVLRGRSRKQWTTSCKRFFEGEVHLKLSNATPWQSTPYGAFFERPRKFICKKCIPKCGWMFWREHAIPCIFFLLYYNCINWRYQQYTMYSEV